ncbi:alpha-hydroxyketone-type quorum-sensing autoinducer synthase [Caenimonas koreensis]|uniref:Quorum-sensing autoinducer synthase n=1 Tax=Caenimonas koreensis DSM 17982 TaxID=1121255 RepID=A0A844AXR7_9BURK|nr:alpha-hydroxyketone-type quorum-sensing autoinducer synthase [Caenimonas koreensis]MRD47198.1 quorum-sensing autoinducer synthase [Caenimonas koreensis DSM 17982]
MEDVVTRSIAPAREPQMPTALRQRIDREFTNRWNDEWGGRFVLHGKGAAPGAVRLDGNDYLAVTGHPEIVQAQVNTLRQDTGSVVQSGVFLLDGHPAHQFERAMADWVGKEDGILCQSGYLANMGLLQSIADESTPVYLDSLAHMSLWEGVRAAKAPGHAFRHNDPAHLARMIERHGAGIVVVDSVYSTTGALCPLLEIVEVCESAGCTIVVDESHSLGTHGPQGAGLCAQLGLTSRVHFITASLAKAFAGRAGFFTVPACMRYYVQSSSFPNIFSSSLLPHEVAGLHATLQVIRRSDDARQRLRDNTRRLRASLTDAGFPIHQGSEQIISLEAGSEPAAMVLRDMLEERGVVGAIFCAPATSKNRAMVRLTLTAGLTQAELEHVENVARAIAPVVKPWEWPIARRNRAARLQGASAAHQANFQP